MRTSTRLTGIALTASLAAASFGLTACSSSSTSAATPTPASSSAMPGSNPGTWSPLHATAADAGKTFEMVPDQVLLIDLETPKGTDLFVKTSDDQVVTVEQAEGSGDVTAVPAVIAKAPGDATITVQQIDDSKDQEPPTVLEFTVHVTG